MTDDPDTGLPVYPDEEPEVLEELLRQIYYTLAPWMDGSIYFTEPYAVDQCVMMQTFCARCGATDMWFVEQITDERGSYTLRRCLKQVQANPVKRQPHD